MEQQVAATIAAKMKEAMRTIDQTWEYMRENVESSERAPFARAIGEVFAIVNDEVYTRLVEANPELHETLFRGMPKDAPDSFLRMSLLGRTPGQDRT